MIAIVKGNSTKNLILTDYKYKVVLQYVLQKFKTNINGNYSNRSYRP